MMVQNFQEIYKGLQESEAFKNFDKQDYHLAHGFVQLNANGGVSKPWHIGYYSPSKDNLAIFSAPDYALNYDEAFKEGGSIAELEYMESFKPTREILEVVQSRIKEAYSSQIPFTYIVILQTITGQPRYNITVVTQAFKMLTFQLDPLTAVITKENESSVLDLKANKE